MKPLALILLTILTLTTAACTPAADPAMRLSTQNEAGCIFVGTDCAALHRTRASVW